MQVDGRAGKISGFFKILLVNWGRWVVHAQLESEYDPGHRSILIAQRCVLRWVYSGNFRVRWDLYGVLDLTPKYHRTSTGNLHALMSRKEFSEGKCFGREKKLKICWKIGIVFCCEKNFKKGKCFGREMKLLKICWKIGVAFCCEKSF